MLFPFTHAHIKIVVEVFGEISHQYVNLFQGFQIGVLGHHVVDLQKRVVIYIIKRSL